MSKPLGKPDRIVVALGGNALGNNPVEQIEAVSNTAHALLGLIEQGNEIIITHGNGPQVGMIQNAFAAAHDAIGTPEMPLPECGAMSQGYIGYHLQNAIGNELTSRKMDKDVATENAAIQERFIFVFSFFFIIKFSSFCNKKPSVSCCLINNFRDER